MARKVKYLRIGDAVNTAVVIFKQSKPYRGDFVSRFSKFSALVSRLSFIYNVKTPDLYVTNPDDAVNPIDKKLKKDRGIYFPDLCLIAMRKFSAITLLHEFRHHLQHEGVIQERIDDDDENDAQAWSLAIYNFVFKKNSTAPRLEREAIIVGRKVKLVVDNGKEKEMKRDGRVNNG